MLPDSDTGGASAPRRRLALLVLPLLLAGCVTMRPRSQRASDSATVIAHVPLQKWGVESCGAGSLSSVLQHYGDHTSMAEWDASLPKTRGGVLTIDMLIAARQKGFDAQLVTGTPQVIEQELLAARPLILMLQVVDYPGRHLDFFHYVVVDGFDPARNLIRIQWGDQRGRWTDFQTIEKPWAGGGHAAILIHPKSGIDDDSLRAAVALEDAGRVAEAVTRYRDILSRNPRSAVAWTNLGNAERALGDRAEAERAFRKALEIDPGSGDTLNNLAWLLYEDKRLDEAESLARKAASESGPDAYLVLDTLAHVLAARGSCDEALTTFHHAIDAVPSGRAEARGDIERAMAEATTRCRSSS